MERQNSASTTATGTSLSIRDRIAVSYIWSSSRSVEILEAAVRTLPQK